MEQTGAANGARNGASVSLRSPPSVVHIGPHKYAVRTDRDVLARYERDTKKLVYGAIRWTQRDILIDPDATAQAMALLHEVLHGCTEVAGLWGVKNEERLVTAIAPLLLDTLRRNPALVHYLMTEGVQ